ncbi:MAG: FAD-dependent oxidoreductase [Micromonosporaceae bacterium]
MSRHETPPAGFSTSLNAARRERELDELTGAPQVDVLVIGGGITGAGVALDAASRGLSVALAEKYDLAYGTSRWSSKLVHGGLRYLASGGLGIAYESAVERDILLRRTAPHLVRPFPQVIPLLPRVNGTVVHGGYLAGDALRRFAGTSGQVLPHCRRISRTETCRYVPTVRMDGLRGGILGWDGQLYDDARLVVAVARTAAGYGARILTRCAAEQVTGTGAVLHDRLTGHRFDVAARTVINATGVWAGHVAPGVTLRPSRGSHLVFGADRFAGLNAGLTAPVPGERNRFVFALPAPGGRVYVGLTDEATDTVPDVPAATDAEIDFLIDTINTVLRVPVTRADVRGSYAGLRPLLDDGDGRTADLSRRHAVITAPDGLVTVVGGKLTTYRRMAQDAVDTAVAHTGIDAGSCVTQRLPLVGARGRFTGRVPETLRRRYGAEAHAVLTEASDAPELLAPIADGFEVTGADLRFAVRHEGALDVADLLDRRTRIGLVPADRERALASAEQALQAS